MQRLTVLAAQVTHLSQAIGRVSASLLILLALVQLTAVLARHAFGVGFLYAQDSTLYLFSLAFLGGIGWLALSDGHVRVDLFHARYPLVWRQRVDIVGTLFLWLPFASALFFLSVPYAGAAWSVFEGSRDPSGVDLVFLLKSLLPLFAALLFVQGLARLVIVLNTPYKQAP